MGKSLNNKKLNFKILFLIIGIFSFLVGLAFGYFKIFKNEKLIFSQRILKPHLQAYNLILKISKSFSARGKEQAIQELSFLAYSKNFRGGVNVTCGDIDDNGKDEIITSPKKGGTSQIRIFDGKGKFIDSFYAYPEKENLGTKVALGDVDSDGKKEIITSPETKDSTIKIFKNQKLNLSEAKEPVLNKIENLDEITPFSNFSIQPIKINFVKEAAAADDSLTLLNTTFVKQLEFQAWKDIAAGATITVGDINSDGKDEIILGAGKGGGPQIKIYNYEGKEISSFFAFHPRSRGGVDVAAADVDQDGKAEIVASEKQGDSALVKIYKADKTNSLISTFFAYPKNLKVDVNIAAGDLEGDGEVEILTVLSLSKRTQIRGFKINGEPLPINFFAFDNNFYEEADIAICNLDGNGKKEIVVGAGQGRNPKVKIFYKY